MNRVAKSITAIAMTFIAIGWWHSALGWTGLPSEKTVLVPMANDTLIIDTICNSDLPYEDYGFNIPDTLEPTQPHNIVDTLEDGGRDVILHLFVAPEYVTNKTRRFWCNDKPFTEYGVDSVYPALGTHTYIGVMPTIYGCDSTFYVNITAYPGYDILIEDTLCEGGSYDTMGFHIPDLQVGIYYDTLVEGQTDEYGCDSIIRLLLHVGSYYNNEYDDEICEGEPYNQHSIDTTGLAPGVHHITKHHESIYHCDSIETVHLTVHPLHNDTINVHLCEGESYTEYGFSYITPAVGIYQQTHASTSIHGCDSIFVLNLNVTHVYNDTIYDTIGMGDDYNLYNFHINNPAVGQHHAEQHLQTAAGCDSVVNLELYVAERYTIHIYDTICDGEFPYDQHNFYLESPHIGLNIDTNFFQTIFNYDSLEILHLSVGALYDTLINDTICFGESYDENSFNFDNPPVGISRDTLRLESIYHCDSIVKLELRVAPVYDTLLYDTICFGEDYTENGFQIYGPPTGSMFDTIVPPTIDGCDSVVRIKLQVWPSYHFYDVKDTICYGNQYTNYGLDTLIQQPGEHYLTSALKTIHDCDSIFDIILRVGSIDTTYLKPIICEGMSYETNGFSYINPAVGTYYDTLHTTSMYHCDSTVMLKLMVFSEPDTVVKYDTICNKDPYTEYGFNINCGDLTPQTNAGDNTFYNVVITPASCDSVTELHLYAYPTYMFPITADYCQGDSIDLDELDTAFIVNGDTVFEIEYKTIHGCDSIYLITAIEHEVYSFMFDTIICDSAHFNYLNLDTIFPGPNDYTVVHHYATNEYGCDSIYTYNVHVKPNMEFTFNDTICYGIDYSGHGFEIQNSEVGLNPYVHNFQTIYGCDSIIYLNLLVSPTYDTLFTDTICAGDPYHGHGFDFDTVAGGTHLFTHNFTTSIFGCDSIVRLKLYAGTYDTTYINSVICFGDSYNENGFHYDSPDAGVYHDTIINCDSVTTLQLIVGSLDTVRFTDTICLGENYVNNPDSNFVYINPAVGFYYDTAHLTSIYGCDSTLTLAFYVAPIYDTLFTDTICQDDRYVKHGFYFENTNNFNIGEWNNISRTIPTMLGCDSVINLDLYVAPIHDIQLIDTIHIGEEYHGYNFDTVGLTVGTHTLIDSLETEIFGCDSIVTLKVIVGALDTTRFSDTICFGEDYVNNPDSNFVYINPAVGFYYDTAHLTSMYGYDSTLILALYVAPVYDTLFTDTICQGDSYDKHGFYYENTDEFTIGEWNDITRTDPTMFGCDSVINVNLYVAPIYDIHLLDTTCFNEEYNGYNFHADSLPVGTHTLIDSLKTNIFGCDSIVTLRLIVGSLDTVRFTDTICFGEDYVNNSDSNFVYINPAVGFYYDTARLTSRYGCDSTLTLAIYVAPTYDTLFTDTICQGDSYDQHGFYYENTDEFTIGEWNDITRTDPTMFGCDSVINVNLYVAPIYDIHLLDTTCFNEEYNGYNFHVDSLPVGTHTLIDSLTTNIFGCDSIVTLQLIVGSLDTVRFTDTICFGEDYVNNPDSNFVYINPAVGFYYDTARLESRYGCDSTLTLALYVAPVYETLFTDTICQGDSYDQHGFYFENTDEFTIGEWNDITRTDTTIFGCDSVINVNLYVAPIYDTLLYDTICHYDYYDRNGFGFDTDSLPVEWNRITRTDPTIYGCDSVINLDLYIATTYDTLFTDTICINEQPYQLHGFDLDGLSVGRHYDTLYKQSILDCDSTVYLDLYIAPIYDTLFTDSICYDEQPYQLHGFDLSDLTVGDCSDTLFKESVLGCDSIVRLDLYVKPIYDISYCDTICFGESYHDSILHFDTISPAAGLCVMTQHLQTSLHCDSIVTMNLIVGEVYDYIIYDTICEGQEYHDHNFNVSNPKVGDNYVIHYEKTHYGCDSIVWLYLYAREVYDINISDTICIGDDYEEHNFSVISPSVGQHTFVCDTVSTNGCDSTTTLHLWVGDLFLTDVIDSICFGQIYEENGFHLDSLPVGRHRDTTVMPSILGCDSTICLDLLVLPSYNIIYTDTICEGESYNDTILHFDTISPAAGLCVMTQYLQTSLYCDSIVTMNLLVGANYDTLFVDSVCENQGYYEHGFSKDSLWVGTLYDTMYYKSILGCDSVVRLQLIVNPTFDTLFTDTICEGDSYDKHGFYFENTDDFEIGEWNDITRTDTTIFGCDSVIDVNLYVAPIYNISLLDTTCFDEPYTGYGFDTVGLSAGTHTLIDSLKTNIFGCDSIVTLQLIVGSLDTVRFTDTICFGEDYVNNPDSNFVFINPEVGFHYDTARLTSRYGCDSTLTLALYVAPVYDTLFTDTICEGDSYDQHGFYYENTDEFEIGEWNNITRTDTTMLGCDSVINVNLYVAQIYDTLLFDTICHHDYYDRNGFSFDTDSLTEGLNSITRTDPTVYGCDSVINLYLYVAPIYDTLFVDSVCENQGYYEHGFSLEGLQAGWHSDSLNLQTIYTCDSTVYLELYVKPVHDTLFTDTICFGESYHEHNFHLDTPDVGWNYDTQNLSTTLDCDSIVRLELYVGPVYDFVVFDSICEGEDYHNYGIDIENARPGISHYGHQQFYTTLGCDSIFDVTLKVLYHYGDIDTIYGPVLVPVSDDLYTGEYDYHINPIEGCDKYDWSIEYIWLDGDVKWDFEPSYDSCHLQVNARGSAIISVSAGNMCDTVLKTIHVSSEFHSVAENGDIEVEIYPNPFKNALNVECDNIMEINIFNITGVPMRHLKFDHEGKVTIDLADLTASAYVIEIITSDGICRKQITKTRY